MKQLATAEPSPSSGSAEARSGAATTRAQAAHTLQVLGDDQARPLRQRAWKATPRGAAPSDEVRHLSPLWNITVEQADEFLGPDAPLQALFYEEMRNGDVSGLVWLICHATVTYLDLARFLPALHKHGQTPRPVPGISSQDWLDFTS